MTAGKSRLPRSPKPHGLKDSPERRAEFLDELRRGGSPRSAAVKAGIDRSTAFMWKRKDAAFAALWAEASEEGYDRLEEEARRRAEKGYDRPVFQGGECVGHVTEYSDTLMTVLLKGRRPNVFNIERHEHTGKDGGPVQSVVRSMSPKEAAAAWAASRRKRA